MGKPALLVIDVQKGLDDPSWGKRNNPEAESNIASLLSRWRKQKLPIIHIRHCSAMPNSPLRPGLPGNAYKEEAQPLPGEKQFSSSLVIVGLTTDHCVSTSVRMAGNLGFGVTLISDATATFDRQGYDGAWYSADDIHQVNLVSLDGEFCRVRCTEDVLKEIA